MNTFSLQDGFHIRRSPTSRIGLAAVVAVCMAAVLGSATQAADAGAAPYAATRVADSERGSDREYNPEKEYSGMFESARIYHIAHHTEGWAGSKRPARLNQITCREARTALEERGFWRGPLSVTGGCGAGEPTEWATGNFLNFQSNSHDGSES